MDPQFRVAEGHTFTSDLCLLQLLVEASLRLRVLVLKAYKPRVPGALEDVTAWHLAASVLYEKESLVTLTLSYTV